MLPILKNRETIDELIGKNIEVTNAYKLLGERREIEMKALVRCTEFLRGLMRTHTHLPRKGYNMSELTEKERGYVQDGKDMRPQYFLQDKKGRPVLIKEFLAPGTKNLLPEMKRLNLRSAKKKKMTKKNNSLTGYVVEVSPFHNFDIGHAVFIVCFKTMIAEPIKKKSSYF